MSLPNSSGLSRSARGAARLGGRGAAAGPRARRAGNAVFSFSWGGVATRFLGQLVDGVLLRLRRDDLGVGAGGPRLGEVAPQHRLHLDLVGHVHAVAAQYADQHCV